MLLAGDCMLCYVLWSAFREVNSGFFYKSAKEREKLVQAERAFIDDRVRKIIEMKNKVCDGNDKGFVVINQKVGVLFVHNCKSLTVPCVHLLHLPQGNVY